MRPLITPDSLGKESKPEPVCTTEPNGDVRAVEDMHANQAERENSSHQCDHPTLIESLAQRRFFTLFNQSPLPLIEVDNKGLIVSTNFAFREMFALGENNSQPVHISNLLNGTDQGKVVQSFVVAEQVGSVELNELAFCLSSGDIHSGKMHISRLPTEVGQTPQFICTLIDQTIPIDLLSRLKAHEWHAQQTLDTIATCVAVIDSQRQFVSVNPSMATLTGYTEDELIGHSSQALYPDKEVFTTFGSEKIRQIQDRGICKTEGRMLHKDGHSIDVSLSMTPIIQDQPSGLTAVVVNDITQQKQIEEQLYLKSTALDIAANAVIICRRDGTIEWANPAFFNMTGYPIDEVIGRNPRDLVRSGQQDKSIYAELWQTISAGQVWSGELINRRKDGSFYHEFQTITPVPDKNGNISHFISVKQDISQRITNEKELAEYHEHLEKMVADRTASLHAATLKSEHLARVKGDFLANMSHEIRTPLNVVIGLSQTGLRSHVGQKCAETFARILQSGEFLLGIINDILDFSKIEAGKLKIEMAPVSLVKLGSRAIDMISEQAHRKGLVLSFRCAPDLPIFCQADELRLLQILINLLSNAVKFTERGSVTLDIYRLGSQLIFRIKDTGIGMSHEQMGKLFEAFEQADSSIARRFGGTGLGLAISKRLLDLMQGTIRVNSIPEQGSIFEFHLPYITAEEPLPFLHDYQPSAPSLFGLRILAAEDEEINRLVLQEMLAEEGVELTIVENGQAAVDQVILKGHKAWDVILMDIMMPIMDGYEATRHIRRLAPDLPIISLSAHVYEEERERFISAGITAHVAKPILLEELIATIQRHTKQPDISN